MDREEKQIGQMCVVVLGVDVNRAWIGKRNKEFKPVVVLYGRRQGVCEIQRVRGKGGGGPVREVGMEGRRKYVCVFACFRD